MYFGSFCQILLWFLGGLNANSYWFLGRFQFIFNRFLQVIEGETDLTYFDNSKYMSENHTRTFWVLFVNIFTKYLSQINRVSGTFKKQLHLVFERF